MRHSSRWFSFRLRRQFERCRQNTNLEHGTNSRQEKAFRYKLFLCLKYVNLCCFWVDFKNKSKSKKALKKSVEKTSQKLLCSMYNHMACVNCVRWSLSGKYLASGADDRLVMIWSFGGMAKKGDEEQENWKCIHRISSTFYFDTFF